MPTPAHVFLHAQQHSAQAHLPMALYDRVARLMQAYAESRTLHEGHVMPTHEELSSIRHALRQLFAQADLPAGPFTWEHVYEMGDGDVHWALCDPANAQEGRITDANLVLKTTSSTWSGDAPETWRQPLDTYPRLALIAALLTHAKVLLGIEEV